MSREDFDKLLLQAVDEGLASVGESSKQAIYFHLEKGFMVKKQEIPHRIRDFEVAIEKIFGLGANFLEILIMKRLYEKIGGHLELAGAQDLAFIEYVVAARRSFLNKGTKKTTEAIVRCEPTVMKR